MAGMKYRREFGRAIYNDWIALVNGPASLVLMAIGVVFAAMGWNLSVWCVLAAAIACLVITSYSIWAKEHEARESAEQKLKPLLEIAGVGPTDGQIYRIRIRNLSSGSIRFVVKLVDIRPNDGFVLPENFQPIIGEEQKEVEVHGDGERPVDIFASMGYCLKLINAEPWDGRLRRGERYELRICVHPVGDGAIPALRWFYIVPQADGSVVFTADGSGELV